MFWLVTEQWNNGYIDGVMENRADQGQGEAHADPGLILDLGASPVVLAESRVEFNFVWWLPPDPELYLIH